MKKITTVFLVNVLGILSARANAFPVNRILLNPPAQYIQEYRSRMDSWYQKQFADYQSLLSGNERKLLQLAERDVQDWGLVVSDKWTYRSFWYAHHVLGTEALHRNIFFAVNAANPEQKVLLLQILRSRGVDPKLPIKSIWGLSFDLDNNIFEVQLQIKKTDLSAMKIWTGKQQAEFEKLIQAQSGDDSFDLWLMHLVYRNGQLQDVGLTIPMMSTADLSRAVYPKLLTILAWAKRIYVSGKSDQLLQLADLGSYALSDMGKFIMIKHRQEFGQLPLLMVWKSPEDFTLYYP